jgi:hypothetical protein
MSSQLKCVVVLSLAGSLAQAEEAQGPCQDPLAPTCLEQAVRQVATPGREAAADEIPESNMALWQPWAQQALQGSDTAAGAVSGELRVSRPSGFGTRLWLAEVGAEARVTAGLQVGASQQGDVTNQARGATTLRLRSGLPEGWALPGRPSVEAAYQVFPVGPSRLTLRVQGVAPLGRGQVAASIYGGQNVERLTFPGAGTEAGVEVGVRQPSPLPWLQVGGEAQLGVVDNWLFGLAPVVKVGPSLALRWGRLSLAAAALVDLSRVGVQVEPTVVLRVGEGTDQSAVTPDRFSIGRP